MGVANLITLRSHFGPSTSVAVRDGGENHRAHSAEALASGHKCTGITDAARIVLRQLPEGDVHRDRDLTGLPGAGGA